MLHLSLLLLFVSSIAAAAGPVAAPIPPHKVGDSEPVVGVCWSVDSGASYEHVFPASNDEAVVFYFDGVSVQRPQDIVLCAGSFCRANHKPQSSFWSSPLGRGNADSITVTVQGPSTGCITERAGLNQKGIGESNRRNARDHEMTLPCATAVDDNIPAKCSADGACNPLPEVYNRAEAVASILFKKSRSWYVCTAWLTSNQGHVITNNHCVSDQTVASTIEFYFGCELGCSYNATICDYSSSVSGAAKCHKCDMSQAYGTACYSQPVQGPRATGATFLRTDAALDYTLLKISSPGSVPCVSKTGCPLRLVPATFAITNQNIFMFHHSAGKPKLLSYFNSVSSADRVAIRGTYNGCYASDLHYDADMVGGSSGSAVLLASDYCGSSG